MSGEIITDLLLADVAYNTAMTGQMAAMPEFQKEALFLAQGFYQEIRAESASTRFICNLGAFTLTGLLMYNNFVYDPNAWLWVPLVFMWALIAALFRNGARKQANEKAWSVVQMKLHKEAVIREAMYQAAENRMSDLRAIR